MAEPFTKEERDALLAEVRGIGTRDGVVAREYRDHGRYEATVAKAERERDAWRIVARYNACFSKPGDIIHDMRMRGDAVSPMGKEYLAALEMLCPKGEWPEARL